MPAYELTIEYFWEAFRSEYVAKITLRIKTDDASYIPVQLRSDSIVMDEKMSAKWGFIPQDQHISDLHRTQFISLRDGERGPLRVAAEAAAAEIRSQMAAIIESNRPKGPRGSVSETLSVTKFTETLE